MVASSSQVGAMKTTSLPANSSTKVFSLGNSATQGGQPVDQKSSTTTLQRSDDRSNFMPSIAVISKPNAGVFHLADCAWTQSNVTRIKTIEPNSFLNNMRVPSGSELRLCAWRT